MSRRTVPVSSRDPRSERLGTLTITDSTVSGNRTTVTDSRVGVSLVYGASPRGAIDRRHRSTWCQPGASGSGCDFGAVEVTAEGISGRR